MQELVLPLRVVVGQGGVRDGATPLLGLRLQRGVRQLAEQTQIVERGEARSDNGDVLGAQSSQRAADGVGLRSRL